jgi:hypothetical protein
LEEKVAGAVITVFGGILQRLQTIRHCERSEAIQRNAANNGLLRRFRSSQ